MESPLPPPRRGLALHSLRIIKRACLDALDLEQPDRALFRTVVEPGLVWELAILVEQLQHDNEVLRRHLVAKGWVLKPDEADSSRAMPPHAPDAEVPLPWHPPSTQKTHDPSGVAEVPQNLVAECMNRCGQSPRQERAFDGNSPHCP